jgi:hypothetical protein
LDLTSVVDCELGLTKHEKMTVLEYFVYHHVLDHVDVDVDSRPFLPPFSSISNSCSASV